MMAWLPVFFLYFNENLEIKSVILLESIYYISVVVLEVPSGFFSDKIGRRITLILSSVFFCIAYIIFGFADPSFEIFALAQVVLAGGMSFMSGTNTSFYFESLQELGLEKEFAPREAKVQSWLQYTGAFALLLGGFVGAYYLNWAYIASLIFILPALFITLAFKEPSDNVEHIPSGESRIGEVLSYLKVSELRWIFLFSVVAYVLTHIPYEFYQPYLYLLDLEKVSINTAISSGILFAIARVFGAFAAGRSVIWAKRFGLKLMCFISIVLQLIIIGMLSWLLNPIFLVLLILRSFSMSLTKAPLNAEIAPRVLKDHRASYFSLQSLASRLAFSVTLVLLSLIVGGEVINDWASLSKILFYAAAGGLIVSLPLLFVSSGSLFEKVSSSNS